MLRRSRSVQIFLDKLHRAVPFKVRACQGIPEGLSGEVLCLDTPCVALIRGVKNQRLRLDLELQGVLHSTCRAPVWLVGVELVGPENGMIDLVKYCGDSGSGLLRGCGVHVDKS